MAIAEICRPPPKKVDSNESSRTLGVQLCAQHEVEDKVLIFNVITDQWITTFCPEYGQLALNQTAALAKWSVHPAMTKLA